MKKVCFFNSTNFWGGGEKLHLENAIEFRKKGYSVIMLCNPNSPLWTKANSAGLTTIPIVVENLSFINLHKIWTLVKLYKRESIDTLIFSTSQDMKPGSISAKLAGVKNIVYLRGLSVPIKAKLLNKFIFSKILTHIIVNSEETKKQALRYIKKYIAPSKIKTIYHGIHSESIKNKDIVKSKEIQEKGHGIILGNAGRLSPEKGQTYLINIAKKLRDRNIDFTLFIAGTGDLEYTLQSLISKYNLQDNVIILGFIEDMDTFMNSIDIFLMTSISEGFGYVLVEAMVKSKPIVGFHKTSTPEIVENNRTGFLVNYPDLEMFTDKIIQLINENTLRIEMGKNGRETVFRRFILEDKVDEIESFLLG